MKEIYNCDKYKVLEANLTIGEKMPLHEATSDALIICKKGKGLITFFDKKVHIQGDETLLIEAHKQHQLEILEDFSANIILENDGKINFIKEEIREEIPADVF